MDILSYYRKEKFPLLSLLILIEKLSMRHQDEFPYADMGSLVEWLSPIEIPIRKERNLKAFEFTSVSNMLAFRLKCPESTIIDIWKGRRKDG